MSFLRSTSRLSSHLWTQSRRLIHTNTPKSTSPLSPYLKTSAFIFANIALFYAYQKGYFASQEAVFAEESAAAKAFANYISKVKSTGKAVQIDNPNEFYDIYRSKNCDIFLDVFTTWCKYCVIMEPEYDKFARVLAENGVTNALVVKWDRDRFKPPVEARTVPTIVFIAAGEQDGDDQRLYRYNRERSARDFAQFIVDANGRSAPEVKKLLDSGKFD